jgi:hypothetical protein
MSEHVNHRVLRLAAALAIAASALVGCGKKETPSTEGGAVVPSGGQPAALQVADVKLGKNIGADKHVANQTDTFAPRDTVYAAVHTTGTAQNAQIVGRWAFQDGQVVDERTESISPTGDAYTEFHITKPTGWPAGKYTLHVLVNGQEVQTKDFTVK